MPITLQDELRCEKTLYSHAEPATEYWINIFEVAHEGRIWSLAWPTEQHARDDAFHGYWGWAYRETIHMRPGVHGKPVAQVIQFKEALAQKQSPTMRWMQEREAQSAIAKARGEGQ